MKTDARTRYTKSAIRKCFFELLKDTPLDQITVKAICDKAEINRSTFYRHYTDVYDLTSKLETTIRAEIKQKVSRSENSLSFYEASMLSARENPELYLILRATNSARGFEPNFVADGFEYFKDSFVKRYPQLNPAQVHWLYQFVSAGSMQIVCSWLDGGMKEDPKEVAAFITQLTDFVLKPWEQH